MRHNVIKYICFLSFVVMSFAGVSHSHAFEVQSSNQEYSVSTLLCSYTIRGVWHQPVPDAGKPLLILVHGATYGKWMWDVPGYSWINHFVADLGYPVLTIDRLGYGESSHPNGDLLTPRCQVYTLKQVLDQVSNSLGQRPIIWVGHSMGALFGNMIAGETDLLDGLISIGFLHVQQTSTGPSLLECLADDYVSWTNEERTTAFYYMQGADPEIIDYDNQCAEPMPRGAIWSSIKPDLLVLGRINLPVLLASGQYDALWEEIDLAAEAGLFTNALVTTFVQENAGHTNLLHQSNVTLLDEIESWLVTYF
ncbi:alpha/beta fold hydrolase [Desulfobacter sp.]|uniref:alpha/beta hydrolase n=1 Tax=Desulfobacter sp. TaxID=2294 RepID=UPI0025794BD7|nr:alpha/beta fold hydrolase [Desulfobacter sp.]